MPNRVVKVSKLRPAMKTIRFFIIITAIAVACETDIERVSLGKDTEEAIHQFSESYYFKDIRIFLTKEHSNHPNTLIIDCIQTDKSPKLDQLHYLIGKGIYQSLGVEMQQKILDINVQLSVKDNKFLTVMPCAEKS